MSESVWAGRIGKMVKGMFVALALDAALSEETGATEIVLTILGATIALTAGEIYGSAVEAEFRLRRRLARSDVARLVTDTSYIVLGALPSLALFVLAGLGAFSSRTAANIALWSGIVLLAVLGLAVDRLSGRRGAGALVHGVELAALGALVYLLKTLAY